MDFLEQTKYSNYILDFCRIYFIIFFTFKISMKLINKNRSSLKYNIRMVIEVTIISVIYMFIKEMSSLIYSTIFLVFSLSIKLAKINNNNFRNSMLVIIISLSMNYILFSIAVTLSFIPNVIFKIKNNIVGLFIILIIYGIIIIRFSKIKRIKNGFAFLHKNIQNEYLDILTLNISVIVIFCIIVITNYERGVSRKYVFGLITFAIIMFITIQKSLPNYERGVSRKYVFGLITFAIIMFITIQKSLQLYYKQKQLIKTLEETQAELKKYKKDVKDLEEENLNISKKSHSLVHKQKQLEYKLNELLSQTETTITEKEKEKLNSSIENISKELYTEKAIIELTKTDIPNIDDMLKYQQSKCIKNKIDFDLQISGNIHHMVNTLIPKEDLEILIADHVKDAIIAINHSNNENRSILVRLGKIDECYGIYIYDTGIEFEKETLENLGKKPSTTHADEGGTGMGFMNTFDTLRKCKASLIIKEIGKPSKDNFTKVMMIKFNNKQEFRVESYRNINIEVKLDQDSNNENNSKCKVTIK